MTENSDGSVRKELKKDPERVRRLEEWSNMLEGCLAAKEFTYLRRFPPDYFKDTFLTVSDRDSPIDQTHGQQTYLELTPEQYKDLCDGKPVPVTLPKGSVVQDLSDSYFFRRVIRPIELCLYNKMSYRRIASASPFIGKDSNDETRYESPFLFVPFRVQGSHTYQQLHVDDPDLDAALHGGE